MKGATAFDLDLAIRYRFGLVRAWVRGPTRLLGRRIDRALAACCPPHSYATGGRYL